MRRPTRARRLAAGGGVALVVAVIAGVAIAPDLGGASSDSAAPPSTLSRIGQKNDRAAADAAARMREQSRLEAQRADAQRAAEERGRAKADEMLARFDDNQAEPATIAQ